MAVSVGQGVITGIVCSIIKCTYSIMFIGPLRSAVPGQVIEREHDTKFEPVLHRYRRAPGDIDPTKLSCTLKMRVS